MGIANDIYLVVSVYTPNNVCWQRAKEFFWAWFLWLLGRLTMPRSLWQLPVTTELWGLLSDPTRSRCLSFRSKRSRGRACHTIFIPSHCWSAGNGTALSNAGGNQALSLHPGLLPFIRSERNFKTNKLTNKGNFIFLLELANLYCFVNLCDSVPVSHGEVSPGVQKSDKAQDISNVCFFVCVLEFILVHVSQLDCVDKLMSCVYFPLWQQVPPAGWIRTISNPTFLLL